MHTTSLTLLERLRRPEDEGAWTRLVELYTPLLFAWTRGCGESDHDAADLVQEVFVALVQNLPTYRHDRQGNFRRWLRTLLLNKLRDRKRREVRAGRALARLPHDEELPDVAEQYWEEDFRMDLARRALELMQAEFTPSTWQACWQTVVEGRSAADVARELGLTENAVYIARCRVLRRLRQELGGLPD
jgi:RNA polymerase sigma-70 factor (ECF subfamily)